MCLFRTITCPTYCAGFSDLVEAPCQSRLKPAHAYPVLAGILLATEQRSAGTATGVRLIPIPCALFCTPVDLHSAASVTRSTRVEQHRKNTSARLHFWMLGCAFGAHVPMVPLFHRPYTFHSCSAAAVGTVLAHAPDVWVPLGNPHAVSHHVLTHIQWPLILVLPCDLHAIDTTNAPLVCLQLMATLCCPFATLAGICGPSACQCVMC